MVAVVADAVARLPIDEASAKIRSGAPADDAADFGWPAWGGLIPLSIVAGRPEPDEHVTDVRQRPPAVARFRKK